MNHMTHESHIDRHPSAVFFKLDSRRGKSVHTTAYPGAEISSDFPRFTGHQEQTNTASPYYCLPLFDVSMTVDVTSTIAQSSLIQYFHNPANVAISESTYSFPLYDGAIISSFRCTIGDQKVLEGQVKPTAEAQAIFKKAVADKQAAALLQEHTPEIFEVRLGNLPPKTTTKVEITYVNELKADIEAEGLLLTVPTSIAPRYGSAPTKQSSASSYSMQGGLKVIVNVRGPVPIRKMESTTHPISIEIGHVKRTEVLTSFSGLASGSQATDNSPGQARASLNDRSARLDKDFVLKIIATGSALLSSQALWQPALTPDGDGAMMVGLNPCELLPSLTRSEKFQGEIVLIADRSGSMASKINQLREALTTFLLNLPPSCYFNIISFGSQASALWPRSRRRSEAMFQTAMNHLKEGFHADMGGTEILSAIKRSFMMRRTSGVVSTEIIVLTDGEVWNTESVVQYVRQARAESKDSVRWFALGIGSSVSHNLIENIGTAGGGFGEVVQVSETGRWSDRIIKLLNGALVPNSWSCRIALSTAQHEITEDSTAVTGFEHGSGSVEGSTYLKAPHNTSGFHPFRRQSIYFILKPTFRNAPKQVTVEVSTSSGASTKISIPVIATNDKFPALHVLAAKAVLCDLENGKSCFHSSRYRDAPSLAFSESQLASIVIEEGERLGMTYGIASKWTTFVATESLNNEQSKARKYRAEQLDLALLTQQTAKYCIQPSTRSSSIQPDCLSTISRMSKASAPLRYPVRESRMPISTDDLRLHGLSYGDTTYLSRPEYYESYSPSGIVTGWDGCCIQQAITSSSSVTTGHTQGTSVPFRTVSVARDSRLPSIRRPPPIKLSPARYPGISQSPHRHDPSGPHNTSRGSVSVTTGSETLTPDFSQHSPRRLYHSVASGISTGERSHPGVIATHQELVKSRYCSIEQDKAATKILDWTIKDNETCKAFWLCGAAQRDRSMTLCRVVQERPHELRALSVFNLSDEQGKIGCLGEFPVSVAKDLAGHVSAYNDLISETISTDNFKSLPVSKQWQVLVIKPLSRLPIDALPERVILVINTSNRCDEESIHVVLKLVNQLQGVVGLRLRVLIASSPLMRLHEALRRYYGSYERYSVVGSEGYGDKLQSLSIDLARSMSFGKIAIWG